MATTAVQISSDVKHQKRTECQWFLPAMSIVAAEAPEGEGDKELRYAMALVKFLAAMAVIWVALIILNWRRGNHDMTAV